MSRLFSSLVSKARAFGRAEDGSATLDFVIALPAFMVFFTSAYEAGVLSTRHVVLEHALDTTVRRVRIGQIPNPTHDGLIEVICDFASIIPDCENQIRLEMVVRDPRNWIRPSDDVQCVDREATGDPVLDFNPGLNNELMILRVCALFDPMMPTTGLGKAIPKESGGAYALVSTSSYVMEPFQ